MAKATDLPLSSCEATVVEAGRGRAWMEESREFVLIIGGCVIIATLLTGRPDGIEETELKPGVRVEVISMSIAFSWAVRECLVDAPPELSGDKERLQKE
ncbi:hypothetical protein RIR_jg1399.t1 [Rhizophagus irregularis DAOM 181602=DAOM 197198]|nr:hypothetical protein RIR_jg1399.t1 [Rhizophagus irregularis DAOM 181602=DAOM 197198]